MPRASSRRRGRRRTSARTGPYGSARTSGAATRPARRRTDANAATPSSASSVIDATKLRRQRLRTARPNARTLPPELSIRSASPGYDSRVGAARSAFRRLVAATAGKLTAAAGMLAAVAAIVLALGGAGVLGPLGSVVSGAGDLRATEAPGSGAASAGGAI